jgi:hypothetical protein
MQTSALIGRSFGVLLMRRSMIQNAERTTNRTKQHYNPCVAGDSVRECPATSLSLQRVHKPRCSSTLRGKEKVHRGGTRGHNS